MLMYTIIYYVMLVGNIILNIFNTYIAQFITC